MLFRASWVRGKAAPEVHKCLKNIFYAVQVAQAIICTQSEIIFCFVQFLCLSRSKDPSESACFLFESTVFQFPLDPNCGRHTRDIIFQTCGTFGFANFSDTTNSIWYFDQKVFKYHSCSFWICHALSPFANVIINLCDIRTESCLFLCILLEIVRYAEHCNYVSHNEENSVFLAVDRDKPWSSVDVVYTCPRVQHPCS